MRVGSIAVWAMCVAAAACNRAPVNGQDSSSGEGEAGSAETQGEAETQDEGEAGEASETTFFPDFAPDCGGAVGRYIFPPAHYILVVDRSDASAIPFDHDNDPATPMVTPAQRTDAAINALAEAFPNDTGCNNAEFGTVISPGLSSQGSGQIPNCATDFETITPEPGSTATLLERWQDPPAPGGANTMASAFERAVELAASDSDPIGGAAIVVFWAGPAGCGDGSAAELVDLAVFADLYPGQVVVVLTGPTLGQSADTPDGVPNSIDLAGYWAELEDMGITHTADVEDHTALIDATLTAGADCGPQVKPGARCSVVQSCDLDLSLPPNLPPQYSSQVQEVVVNGESFDYLGDGLDLDACDSGQLGAGFIWIEPRYSLRLCGGACDAMWNCADRPPWPDNALEIEIEYVCPDF